MNLEYSLFRSLLKHLKIIPTCEILQITITAILLTGKFVVIIQGAFERKRICLYTYAINAKVEKS